MPLAAGVQTWGLAPPQRDPLHLNGELTGAEGPRRTAGETGWGFRLWLMLWVSLRAGGLWWWAFLCCPSHPTAAGFLFQAPLQSRTSPSPHQGRPHLHPYDIWALPPVPCSLSLYLPPSGIPLKLGVAGQSQASVFSGSALGSATPLCPSLSPVS